MRWERVPHEHVGVGLPLVAEHLDAVVHTARPVPAALDHPHGTVLELDERDRFVFTLRALSVDLRRHLRVDTLDAWLAEEPPAERDSVAPQVHDRAAARLLHVPKPLRVRTRLLLPLLPQVHATEGPFIRQLLRLHVDRKSVV